MKFQLWKYMRDHRRELSHFNGLLLRHPLLSMGFFLAPAAVAVTSLQNAVALTMMIALVGVPTYLLMSLFGRFIPRFVRIVCSPLLASIFYIPAFYATTASLPQAAERFGFYLPVLVLDIFFTARCSTLAPRTKLHWAFVDILCCCVGIGAALCCVGAFREYFGSATLWGVTVGYFETAPAVLLPFFGFFVVAFLAAGLQLFNKLLRRGIRGYIGLHQMEEEIRHE